MMTEKEEKKCNKDQVFVGSFIHSISLDEPIRIIKNGLIGIRNGKILFVDIQDNLEQLKETHSLNITSDNIYILGQCEFLIPGFVDTHIHAPQYPNAGLGLDLPLLKWLQEYTYPMEKRFSDVAFARSCYKKVVERTLKNGTTTATYFATIHRDSSEALADIVDKLGQRGFIGKVSMDFESPTDYIETTQESLKSTEEFIVNMLKRKSNRVRPIITPRFALTCSQKLLKGLGELAKKYDVHIQSHLCESKAEIQKALSLFPSSKTYTDIYGDSGLLTNKTVMAHCVHMENEEVTRLLLNSTGVSHCPTSNICILSGLCPIRKLMDAGISVGLGTDVSGGYCTSILTAMRDAIKVSKIITVEDTSYKQLSFKEAFYLGTLGGAKALGIADEIGNFEVGKYFDALHVDLAAVGSPISLFAGETMDQMLEKFIMLGDDRNIAQVFVEGCEILFSS